jgi:arsenical pump membrane protein
MIASIVIAILTCVTLICSILFFPKIRIKKIEISTYWIVCIVGAIAMLIFGCVTFEDVFSGLFADSSINPIKILILFLSMTFLSIFLDEVGFFRFLANFMVKHFKSNQKLLFLSLYLMVAVLTIFTSNDIVILTFTPFICYFSKNAKINPIPYLVAEFAAANTYSMMLIIGNPTNIYLATSSNIDFLSYFQVMWLPTLVCGVIQLGLMFLVFNKSLSSKLEANAEEVHIKSKLDLGFGLAHLIICLTLLVVSSYINIDMWLVCIICAASLLVFILTSHLIRHKKLKIILKTTKRLPFALIPFVISMFIIVLALNKQGITNIISDFLGEDLLIIKYGTTSFLSSNLINNIPMSVLFSNIIKIENEVLRNQAIYSTIIGSNLGALLTPVGALAGIMFVELVRKQDIKFSFIQFLKYGSIIMIPTLFIALGMLSVWFY